MYVFNRITVNPQLPKRIDKLQEVANNLWWSWNWKNSFAKSD